MKNLNQCLNRYIEQKDVRNIAVRAGNRDGIFCDEYRSHGGVINSSTLFDMASVTKIMATTSLALIAIDKKMFSPDDYVSKFFNVPEDKECMQLKHLLTHTMGIGHKPLNMEGNSYENIQNYILSIPSDVQIGSEVLYSCPGYILLGKIVEQVFGGRLDILFENFVAKPLGMKNTSFLPDKSNEFVNSNIAPEEAGMVNDYNCRFLGGVAGNAGLFSNMEDVCRYVKMLQNYGTPLMSRETFDAATQNYTHGLSESRGLGFLYVSEKYRQTGTLFAEGTIGHCGHTGQSVFVDPKSGLYCVILSDATVSGAKKYGNEKYDIVMKMREDIHSAIAADLAE